MPISRRTLFRGLAVAAALPVLAPAPASAAGRKWHPGHYVRLARWSADVRRSHFAELDRLAAHPYVTGIKLGLNWYDLEGARGDYSRGFRIVDAYLDKLGSVGKYLMVQVNERSFGEPTLGVVPSYVETVTRPAGESWRGDLAVAAAVWRPAVTDRLIALSRAFAARYDSHPLFEQFSLGETELGVPARHGFSTPAWQTQLGRWFTESKKVWTTTYLRLNANFIGNDAGMRDLITHCVKGGGVTVGGPDPELPLDITGFITANRVFRGHDGGTDLRGRVPWTGEVRTMGPGTRFARPEEIFGYFHDTMRANHIVWPHGPGTLAHVNGVRGRVHTGRPTGGG